MLPDIPFMKMQGAGNDFILIDNRTGLVPDAEKVPFVKRHAPRALGIGADGVIFLENDPEFDLRWDFYNADGSPAEMCGNGARCMAAFARRIGAAGEAMTFRSLAGPIRTTILPDSNVRVRLPDAPRPVPHTLDVEGTPHAVYAINTGVPHAVLPVEDLEGVDVQRLGAAIRYHPHFRPAGTNVNFIARTEDGIAIRTYERGVEGETLACGTGSVAAGIVAEEAYGLAPPVSVRTRSGAVLGIRYTRGESGVSAVDLEGPAVLIYTGIIPAT